MVASPFIHKVGDERQVSDQSGRRAQRTLGGGFLHAPTLIRQIRTAAASLKRSKLADVRPAGIAWVADRGFVFSSKTFVFLASTRTV
jgi:hypothetical protein